MARNAEPLMVMNDESGTKCAWCMRHQGRDFGSGSHGICEVHAEIQYTRYQVSKQPSAIESYTKEQKKRRLW